ncbi:Chromatin-linked adaptor for MSL proteins [Carabus blaptoides fortunei]
MQRLHKQVYLAECKVVCPKCGMKFQHVRNLRRHLVYHNSDSYFACSFCDVRLYSKKSWRKHLKVHDAETNVICKVCNKHVVSKVAYIYHMDYHRNKRVTTDQLFYSCRTCQMEFKLYEELEEHSLQNHCLNIPGEHDYLEGLHAKTLNHNHEYESSKINSHKLDSGHLVENSEVTGASLVPKQTVLHKNSENLKHEYTLQNINASVTFMCNICCRVYNNLIDLKYHVTECVKKLNQPKSFMCDVCGKCFKSAWTLSTHKNGHSSDKPYICDTCGQGFKWLNDLSNHKRRIHEKLRPYVCKICGKTCGTSATLKSHVRYHTGERPYKCTVCKAAFTQNSSLKEHMYKHTGGEEGSCPICAKVFKTPLRLRTHIKRHNTQRKLYPCDLCGRMFTEKSSVRKHKNKIHTDMYQQHV